MPIVSLLTTVRSRLLSSTAIDVYGINGLNPAYVTDFGAEFYRKSGATSTFSDSITHSAASNATMVDSDGLLKWRPHNLALNSENITGGGWSTLNATATANTIVAPDGALSGDTLTASAATGAAYVQSQVFGVDGYMLPTFAVAVKAGTHNVIQLINTGDVLARANFDISSGTIGSTGTKTTATITPLGDGWFLCKIALGATTVVASGWRVYFASSLADGYAPTGTWTGTESIYIWGAHLYRSDLGGMVAVPADARAMPSATTYVPTTSSEVYLPRRGHHVYNGDTWVNKGLLHESEARTNLVTYSEDFTQWININTGTLAADASGPDGEISAVTLVDSGATGISSVFARKDITTSVSTAYTASCFMKADQLSWGLIFISGVGPSGNGGCYFDLANGAVGTADAGFSGIIQSVGSGWYRCSITFTSNAATTAGQLRIYVSEGDNDVTVDLDGTSSILIYGAQLEAASTPSSYIPTSGATVTRSAETLTVPAANLPWPSPVVIGEELVTNGTFDTDLTGWSESGGSGDWSWSAGRAKDSGTGPITLNQTITTEVGKVYLISATAYNVSGGNPALIVGGNVLYQWFSGTSELSTSKAFVATSTSTIVSLSGALATWEADNISVKEINPLSVSIQMQGEMTYADEDLFTQGTFIRWRADSSNYVLTNLGSNTGSGRVIFNQAASGAADSVASDGSYYNPGVNVPFNIASRHGSTFINGATDGTALTADLTPVALPDLSATDLQLGYDYMGTISLFRVWADDLTDAGIADASAPSTVPSLSLTFDGASTSFTDTGMTV